MLDTDENNWNWIFGDLKYGTFDDLKNSTSMLDTDENNWKGTFGNWNKGTFMLDIE